MANSPVVTNPDDLAHGLGELVRRYACLVDARQFDHLIDVFTLDGVLDSGRGIRRGIAEISEAMQSLHRYRSTDHRVAEVEFSRDENDPERAWGRVFCEAHHISDHDGELTNRIMMIRYDDRYRTTDQGWRIEQRTLNLLDEKTLRLGSIDPD